MIGVNILFVSIAAFGIYWVLNYSPLFSFVKKRVVNPWVKELYTCPLCLGFHIGWLCYCVDFGYFSFGYGMVVAVIVYFLALLEKFLVNRVEPPRPKE